MRKHKSVVSILLAIMMVFTFMPAMAFADYTGTAQWGSNYASATDAAGNAATVTRTFESTGLTLASAKIGGSEIDQMNYVDLSGAYINAPASCYASQLTNLVNSRQLVVKAPEGAALGQGVNTTTKEVALNDSVGGWTVTVTSDYNASTFKAPGTVTFTATLTHADPVTMTGADTSHAKKINETTLTATMSVIADGSTHDKKFYDKASETTYGDAGATTTTVEASYDGLEHSIVIDAPSLYTVSYQKYSSTAGDYVAAPDGITYKDAILDASGHTVPQYYLAVFTASAGAAPLINGTSNDWGVTAVSGKVGVYTKALTLTVDKSNATPTFDWVAGNAVPFGKAVMNNQSGITYYLTAEQAKDPSAFITFINGLGNTKTKDVDLDTIKESFFDLYEITVTANKIDPKQQTWTIGIKDAYKSSVVGTTEANKAWAAFTKKYKTLADNYVLTSGMAPGQNITGSRYGFTVNVVSDEEIVVSNDKDDDITFTKAEGQKYSYKKVLKKKSKTFTVKAVADSGNAVSYSIVSSNTNKIKINASTGKITVKKGLKKGTYTVVIKAKTAAGNGYKAASEKATIKVKVTK